MAIAKEEFEKSLKKLESMAKSQLFQTPHDSAVTSWGSDSAPEDEDSMNSMIDDNGTDYNGVKKSLADKVGKGQALTKAESILVSGGNPMKTIGAKIAKGEKLTAAESWCAKGGYKAMMPMGKPPVMKSDEKPGEAPAPGDAHGAKDAVATHAGSEDSDDDTQEEVAKGHDCDGDDDEDDEMGKSLGNVAKSSRTLQGGIEMSPFLSEFVHAIDLALRSNEKNVSKSLLKGLNSIVSRIETLEKSHSAYVTDTTEFNKSLAQAVVGMGSQIASTAEVYNQVASGPARGPKSQMRSIQGGQTLQGPNSQVSAIQKSFGPGGLETDLVKSQVVDVLVDLVKGGKIQAVDAIKYEATGELSPGVESLVRSAVNAGAR